jgi:hypothetical protein
MQTAERVDQQQDRNRHAEQPQQHVSSHQPSPQWFDGDTMQKGRVRFRFFSLSQRKRGEVEFNAPA